MERAIKQQHWPGIYLRFLLWVFVAPLGGHQDIHACKNSSLQMDSSHGLHQNTCMACCWKGKYRKPYWQQSLIRLQNCIYLQSTRIWGTRSTWNFVSKRPICRNYLLHYVWTDACRGHQWCAVHELGLSYGYTTSVLCREGKDWGERAQE